MMTAASDAAIGTSSPLRCLYYGSIRGPMVDRQSPGRSAAPLLKGCYNVAV